MPCLRFAMVCASNNNRSMEAHALLKKENYQVSSFGVGGHVKLPGPSQREPNVYNFGTPYETIFEDLRRQNPELYTRNGLLQMLQRNMGVKRAPERWQDSKEVFDVVITFEERVMDQLVEDMNSRSQSSMKTLLVINLDVKDNATEAANAAPLALRLCEMLQAADDWEDEIDEIIAKFEDETGRKPLYTICFY
ncbi:hypothetical protein WJX72_002542 [[Myrmecia] bisecta]|uniref:RNA polymerase II subunit A C-terminal domain phosphatase SSU72 n=1 Tax=[Myrmecia] bisecta TaxID=41462 RepID=A0AAW1Q6W7_9CHLO